jgi:hypothetical protein
MVLGLELCDMSYFELMLSLNPDPGTVAIVVLRRVLDPFPHARKVNEAEESPSVESAKNVNEAVREAIARAQSIRDNAA